MRIRKYAFVDRNRCVACGACTKGCPVNAISIHNGIRAVVDDSTCLGCGKCMRICPADCLGLVERVANEEAVV